MVLVSQNSLEKSLSLYKPEQRLLLSVDANYPSFSGRFLIGECYYTNESLNHATDIEIQLCLNQLAYVSVYEAIETGVERCLDGRNFELLKREGMVITESRKRFKRPIPTDREIY